jgi:hypothetical protein
MANWWDTATCRSDHSIGLIVFAPGTTITATNNDELLYIRIELFLAFS